MNKLLKFNSLIFISSEDDKYNVLGGIGTYIGLLCREIKRYYPLLNIYWVSKSVTDEDFEETDSSGVKRYYLSDKIDYDSLPFGNLISDQALVEYDYLIKKISSKVYEIIEENSTSNFVIEAGEWEGQGQEIFRNFNRKNVLKVVRLHTPLATCMRQNKLKRNSKNSLQLLNEYLSFRHSDLITSSTNYVKSRVIEDVLGASHPLSKGIITIPNPVDVKLFSPNPKNRKAAIEALNQKIGNKFFTSKTYNILIIGSVERRKGAHFVMDAIPTIVDDNSDARICFVGHIGAKDKKTLNSNSKFVPEELLERIPSRYHNKVSFTGYVDHKDLPLLFQAGDLFPIMSIGDNFPGVVAEIALTEKPIVALSRGGVKEMLLDDHGVFSAYDLGTNTRTSSKKLADAVKYLHDNKEEAKGSAMTVRKVIFNKYNSKKIIDGMFRQYNLKISEKSAQK